MFSNMGLECIVMRQTCLLLPVSSRRYHGLGVQNFELGSQEPEEPQVLSDTTVVLANTCL